MVDPQRLDRGKKRYAEIMQREAPESDIPFVRDGVVGSVFADLWTRPGLTTKERRLISISCVCLASVPMAIEDHIRTALVTGDLTMAEIDEFVLHFAYYAGWPKAAMVHHIVRGLVTELGEA